MAKTAWQSCFMGVRQNDEKLTENLGTTKKQSAIRMWYIDKMQAAESELAKMQKVSI